MGAAKCRTSARRKARIRPNDEANLCRLFASIIAQDVVAPLLKHMEKPGPGAEREVVDLVEKERTPPRV